MKILTLQNEAKVQEEVVLEVVEEHPSHQHPEALHQAVVENDKKNE